MHENPERPLSDPRLIDETRSSEIPDPANTPVERWREYWRKWPLKAWAGQLRDSIDAALFKLDGDRFEPVFQVDEAQGDVFDAMVAELVEYRLARHLLAAVPADHPGNSFTATLFHSGGKPILRLDRRRFEHIPEGPTEFVADGQLYEGRFVKVALNVAQETGSGDGTLTSLLRGWFGPSAGLPGTSHSVEMEFVDGRLVMRPVGVSSVAAGGEVPF